MSTIQDKKTGRITFHMERYESAMEVVEKAKARQITDSRFHNMKTWDIGDWEGVKSYQEALDLMRDGYQPTVEKMRGLFKANKSGESKRFAFQNNVQGFAPVVPLALKNVPNCMIDMRMKPIKAKVIDVYYDMVTSCSVSSERILTTGQELLGTIIELERQGYRFNLYAVQSYSDEQSCDMLVVKVKSASQPLDLKRISFPLAHTAFFRVIGFDWYSKVPGGKYRGGYGQAIGHRLNEDRLGKAVEELFGKTAVYLSAAKVVGKNKDHFKNVLTRGDK